MDSLCLLHCLQEGLLDTMGVRDFEPRVVQQLLEYGYRGNTDVESGPIRSRELTGLRVVRLFHGSSPGCERLCRTRVTGVHSGCRRSLGHRISSSAISRLSAISRCGVSWSSVRSKGVLTPTTRFPVSFRTRRASKCHSFATGERNLRYPTSG